MKRVWIAQCLCPSRHCILANAGVAESEAEAEVIVTILNDAVEELVARGAIHPWCSLCRATALTWRYELGRTKFETMAEAEPALKANVAAQAVTNALFGDLKRSD